MKEKFMSTDSSPLPEWPDDFRRRYISDGLWNDETFPHSLEGVCQKHTERIAVNFYQQQLTYGQLYANSLRLAKYFQNMGLINGDVVIVQLPNSINFIEVTFGLMLAGVVPVFALPTHRELEINAFVQATDAKAFIFQTVIDGFNCKALAESLLIKYAGLKLIQIDPSTSLSQTMVIPPADAERPMVSADDLACFQLSGGTTGTPKLIPRRHRDYLCNIRAAVKSCHFDTSTVYLVVLPMGHNFPMACPGFIGTLFSGGRVVISDKNHPDHCFALIEQQGVTVTALVPPLAMVWLDGAEISRPRLSSLQVLQVGGAKLSYQAAKRVAPILGCSLQQVFGMAEGLICFTRLGDDEEIILSTQGKPMTDADEIRVVDSQGNDLPAGEVGYLLTRGPYTIRGYYGAKEINRYAFTSEGYYRSGDLVRLTSTGYLISEGRDKDQINRGGEKIDCAELEDILLRHPHVSDAAVVGITDDYFGECICAFVLRRDPKLDSVILRRFLQGQGVATFKIPDRFQFPANFDVTGIGKVSKKELRTRLKNEYLKTLHPMK